MQFIILYIFLSSSLFAKSDFCSFSSEFAEKYMHARKNYADNIKRRRDQDKGGKNRSGSIRAKQLSTNWEEVSLKKMVNKLFRTSDVDFVVKGNGKMLIYPKKIRDGEPLIIFDPSGDYFRIAKAKVSGGIVKDESSYFDGEGKPLSSPPKNDESAFHQYAMKSHFKAKP